MHRLFLSCILGCYASLAWANCGADWTSFTRGIQQEAVAMGYPRPTVQRFFDGAAQDPKVIAADRRQGVFQKDFISFAHALISEHRLVHAQKTPPNTPQPLTSCPVITGSHPGSYWPFGRLKRILGSIRAISTRSMRCSPLRKIVGARSCFARKFLQPLSCTFEAILIRARRRALGPVRSA